MSAARPGAAVAASVIVPTRGRPGLVYDCVRSILDGAVQPTELIVVDQSGARDRRLAELGTVGGCTVRYRHSDARGGSAARNAACATATQPLLMFCDDDVIVDADWVQVLHRAASAHGGRDLVTGRVLAMPGSGDYAPSTIGADQPAVYSGRIWGDVLYTNNMAVSAETMASLGGFDERLGPGVRYRAAEDNDLGFRALEAGLRIRYEPAAIVHHRAWRADADRRALSRDYGIGQGAYLAKHASLCDRYALLRLRNELLRPVRDRRVKDAGHEAGAHPLTYALGVARGATGWLVRERLLGRR